MEVKLIIYLLMQENKGDCDGREESIEGEDLLEVVPKILLREVELLCTSHMLVW